MTRPRPKVAGPSGLAAFGKKTSPGNIKTGGVPKPLRMGAQKAMQDMAQKRVAQSRIQKGGYGG